MKLALLSVVKIPALELDTMQKEREGGKAGEGMVVENVGYQNEQNATNEEKE